MLNFKSLKFKIGFLIYLKSCTQVDLQKRIFLDDLMVFFAKLLLRIFFCIFFFEEIEVVAGHRIKLCLNYYFLVRRAKQRFTS